MAERDGPRTVVRPLPGAGGPARSDLFAELAGPLLALAAEAARDPRPDPAAIAGEARRRAEAFEATALRRGVPRDAVGEARDALLAVLEARACGNPALAPAAWTRARRKALPGVPEPDARELGRRRAAAEAAGPARRDLARFLRHCEEAVAAAPRARESPGLRWGLVVPLAVVLGLAAWAGFAEWRFSARLLAALPSETDVLATAGADPAAAARELDALRAAVEDVALRSRGSPLGLAPHLGRFSPGALAERRYAAAADALLPAPLGAALATALATEGGSLSLYDTLRTLAILQGDAPWQPAFVAGWVEDRAADDPTLGAFAVHAAALSGPPAALMAQDPELLGQARDIAAEGNPADFAFLELARDERARALPGWSPAQVADLGASLVRRSGRPLSAEIPGLATAAGWAFASGGGARDAIDRAAGLRARIVGGPAPAPVSEEAVLDVLQAHTLEVWTAELADLRVRPFTDRPSSLLVSGTLGRRDSPLVALFRAVWHEVGGGDPARSYAEQLKVATTFGPINDYVEQGRMEEIRQIFAGLNAALQLDSDAALSRRRLMDVQHRAASVATLNQAPRLVVQTIEDVLAQTTASRDDRSRPRAALAWQRDLAAACRAALTDRYPFAADGADADLAAVSAFLGPGGALARFYTGELASILDTSAAPWTWKPEARLAGFLPESAAFFERAVAVGDALFPAGGSVDMTLAALAQRGVATVSLGGETAPIQATGEASALVWPGPSPDRGFAIAFAGGGAGARQDWAGPWGLLRFLDALHLRARDDGRRFLIDVRLTGTRAYLELAFARPSNPVAARALMAGLTCPVL